MRAWSENANLCRPPLLPVARRCRPGVRVGAQLGHLLCGAHHAVGLVGAVGGNHNPEGPRPVAEERHQDRGGPGDPDDVEHVLGQAGGGEILSRGLERLCVWVIARASSPVQDELTDEAGQREEKPEQEGARPEDEVQQQEEAVDNERANVEVVEGRRIGLGPVFACLLSHAVGGIAGARWEKTEVRTDEREAGCMRAERQHTTRIAPAWQQCVCPCSPTKAAALH